MKISLEESVIKKIQMAILLYDLGKDCFRIVEDIENISVGIILLQDSVEIFLSALCEHLDLAMTGNENFYNYISEIEKEKKEILPLKKRIITLNKQRVNIKHYCVLPNIEECKYFVNDVKLFFSELSSRYLNRDIDSISLVNLIEDEKIKNYLKEAEKNLEKCRYKDCQINCRKALYFAFEKKYDIRYVKGRSSLADILMSDFKSIKEYEEKIEKEVDNPIGYIQFNSEEFKKELIEMGIEYVVFQNIMRLSPEVYYYEERDEWIIKEDYVFIVEYNRENANYCLKNTTRVLLSRQKYLKKEKVGKENGDTLKIEGLTAKVYKKASKNSKVECNLDKNIKYNILINYKVKGLDDNRNYYFICGDESNKGFGNLEVYGYICKDDLSDIFINKFKLRV